MIIKDCIESIRKAGIQISYDRRNNPVIDKPELLNDEQRYWLKNRPHWFVYFLKKEQGMVRCRTCLYYMGQCSKRDDIVIINDKRLIKCDFHRKWQPKRYKFDQDPLYIRGENGRFRSPDRRKRD